MKIKISYIFIFIYFFLNSFALPLGLLYTMLLMPIFYIWLMMQKQQLILSKFLIVLLPFMTVHLIYGVDLYFYFRSLFLVIATYIFLYAAYIYIRRYAFLEKIFIWLFHWNLVFVLLAFVALFTSLKDIFWAGWWISPSVGQMPRLRLLSYEPSYYATLMIPLLVFFTLKLLYYPKNQLYQWRFVGIFIPLLLTFSVGVIGGFVLTFLLFFWVEVLRGFKNRNVFKLFIFLSGLVVFIMLGLLLVYPQNPLYLRIYDIVTLNDNSGNGRTFDSAALAYSMVSLKNIWFGIGMGQIKTLGDNIYREFYNLPIEIFPDIVPTIPNTVAETFAIFGILGLIIRFSVIFYLFYRTKVWRNNFRLILFLYMFIYQFTGSFYINIAEYVIWILAFSAYLPEFDRNPIISPIQTTYENRN